MPDGDSTNANTDARQVRVKASPFQGVGIDEHEGIVEGVFAVSGVVDDDDERIVPGAFGKTIAQRKARIPMGLDHSAGFGVTLDMAEISRDDLPQAIRAASREATGGVWAKGQVMMSDENALRLAELRQRLTTGRPVGMSFTFWEVAHRKAGHVRELVELAVTEWGPQLRLRPRNRLAMVTSAKAGEPTMDELDLWELVDALTAHQKAGKVLSTKNMAALDAAIAELQRIRRAAMGEADDATGDDVPDGKAKAAAPVPPRLLTAQLDLMRLRARVIGA